MIKAFFKKLASSTANDSLATSLRRKRFQHFLAIVERFDKTSITILDIGGWERFWEIQRFSDTANHIILLNTGQVKTHHAGISSVVGDARNMGEFGDQSIDIVFSNSVIEHLETIDNQLKMANEVRRIGKKYFVQTPSYFFPFEPHFLFPMFHWFPVPMRVFLVQHLALGYFEKQKSKADAEKLIREHRLLKKHEFQSLFPDAEIITERFCGFTKSYIAIKDSGAG
jgi:ubiquinone/menaquinone biosynthesis C-methylase UbiE